MKKSNKTYEAPVLESVNVELQAMMTNSCTQHATSCGGGTLGLGGGSNNCTNNTPGGRSRGSNWDDED